MIIEAAHFNVPLYIGGPVQHDTWYFIHKDILEMDQVNLLENDWWRFYRLLTLIDTHK